MRLRSIHIKGFKSFPVDTRLNFNERVTGVVGPNGSGKSNIVDAIRWVLGEQKTTELRLGTMSDVLFNGTKKRKKSGLAQVTLEFDNTKNLIPTEYNQVSVSRFLFRNGDSEYRINDVPCRLKDVRSLFVDTGIGPDSYAIIALNMVDDILTDSNGSRRRMFEQASGISKYKKRKKETLNKLKVTSADLDRVEDLLFEIANNLQDLEKQAKRVERFLKIKDQYKAISIQLHLTQYDEISQNTASLKKQISEETIKHREFETKLRTREAELQKQKKVIISNEEALSSFQKEINELLDAIRKAESERQLVVQQKQFNLQKIENLDKEQKNLKNRLHELGAEIENLNVLSEKEKTVQKVLHDKFSFIEKDYREKKALYESVKADHDEVNLQRRKLIEEKFKLEKFIAVDESQLTNLEAIIERKSGKLDLLVEELATVKSRKEESNKNNELMTKQLLLLQESSEKREEEIQSLTLHSDTLRSRKEKLSRKLDARINEYDLVKSMIDSFEGFPESIRYLNKKWKSNTPLLTDLIYAQEEYKLAIESYLEPYLNYYVVDQAEEAYEALSLLQGAQKGKANFFVLDNLPLEVLVTDDIEGMKAAIHWLEFDEKYLVLMANLLQNVYITDLDLIDMDLLMEEFGEEPFHILDKNGSFIASNYSLSGGSVGLFEGKKLGRKKNLEKLEEEIQEIKHQISVIDQKLIGKRNEISVLESRGEVIEMDKTKSALDSLKIKMVEYDTILGNGERENHVLRNEISQHKDEIAKLDSLIRERKHEIQNLEVQGKDLKKAEVHPDDTLQNHADQLSIAAEAKNNHQIELIKQQNHLQNIQNDLNYRRSEHDKSNKLFNDNEKLNQQLHAELHDLEDKAVDLDQLLHQRYEFKKTKEGDLSTIEKEFYSKRAMINELEESLSENRRKMHQSQFLINELKDKLHDQQFRLQSVNERLKIEFNLSLKDLVDMERSNVPLMDLEEKHDRLKRKIENFGEINTLAIEAFNEMKIRFDTITQQKEDIVLAKESLLNTIDEIETIATQKYLETFEVVNEHFKKVFTRLFKEGDTCNIIMEEPDKPLESRIEIIAKPKGKRPKTLNQLSGGEKTLTAIALLFSLYLYKPAPFCIFDEVDAPLDDANIEKFNNIVKDFSTDSQFIIITHNKATMTAVDVLYGVFMQEMGVSEVAAVDFRNFEHLDTIVASN